MSTVAKRNAALLDHALISNVLIWGQQITVSHLVLTTLIVRQIAHIVAKIMYIKNWKQSSVRATTFGTVVDMIFAVTISLRLWKTKGSAIESAMVLFGGIILFVLEMMKEYEH